jgi:hypothetical protein
MALAGNAAEAAMEADNAPAIMPDMILFMISPSGVITPHVFERSASCARASICFFEKRRLYCFLRLRLVP